MKKPNHTRERVTPRSLFRYTVLKLSPENFVTLMAGYSYKVYEGPLNIIGYRNRFGRPNYFDDIISVYVKSASGKWAVLHYPATTLPGTPSLFKPVNPKGAAILVPKQYVNTYAIGYHKGKYKALVQVKAMKVFRDNNRNKVYDREAVSVDIGFFGINIHRASLGAQVVGADSAGCQVIRDRSDYGQFISLCQEASEMYGNRFTYTLVDL